MKKKLYYHLHNKYLNKSSENKPIVIQCGTQVAHFQK